MSMVKSAEVISVTADIYREGLVSCFACTESARWWVMSERQQLVSCAAHIDRAARRLILRRNSVATEVRVGSL